MNNTTYSAKSSDIKRQWYIIDASGKPLGRVAAEAAKLLRGKHKPTFTPNVDCGDYVIVINTDKVVLTGKKMEQKFYRHHSGYVGGLKEVGYDKIMKEKSDFAVREAVKGMLPKNSIGRKMIKKLKVYRDDKHEHQAQQPEVKNIVK